MKQSKRILAIVLSALMLFTMLPFAALGTFAVSEEDLLSEISLMSYNVKTGSAKSEQFNLINAQSPDIVGLQEITSSTYSSFAKNLSGYTGIQGSARGTSSILQSNEYNPIFYKASKLEAKASGTFWLSDTPATQSKYAESEYYRICTWGLFYVKGTSSPAEYVLSFNTHLDPGPTVNNAYQYTATALQAAALMKQVAAIETSMRDTYLSAGDVLGMTINGDLNVGATHGVSTYITGDGTARTPSGNVANTFTNVRFDHGRSNADSMVANTLSGSKAEATVYASGSSAYLYEFDHIFFTTETMKCTEHKVVCSYDSGDHLPIKETFRLHAYELPTDKWEAALSYDATAMGVVTYAGQKNFTIQNNKMVVDLTTEPGAAHMYNTTNGVDNLIMGSTSNPNVAWTLSPEKYVNTREGATIDMRMKVENLPKITSHTYMNDDGVNWSTGSEPSGILFGGLCFQMMGRQASWYQPDSTKTYTSCVTQIAMVLYDNETLGTDAALIVGVGDRQNRTQRPYTFFFNLPKDENGNAAYARYTLAFDPQTTSTSFYIDGVAQKVNGTENTKMDTVGLMYYTNGTTTGNCFNICLNGPTHASTSASYSQGYHCDFWLDQLSVYADAVTPSGLKVGDFLEKVPVSREALEAWVGVYADLHEEYYTAESWARMQAAIELVDLDKEGLTQGEIGVWAAALKSAFEMREYANIDRLYISDTFSSENQATNGTAWTNGALLFTEAGYDIAQYTVNSMNLASWCRVTAQRVKGDTYKVTRIVPGVFQSGKITGIGTVGGAEIVPEDGFIFAFHTQTDGDTVNPWNPISGGSQYASEEFGERNLAAYKNLDIRLDTLLSFDGVEFNASGDSVISTEGTWVHRYEDGLVRTPINRPAGDLNNGAAEGEPKYLAKDQFDGFETSSYIVLGEALPNMFANVEGDGTITLQVNGGAASDGDKDNQAGVVAAAGDTVTLTAHGDNFAYWKNAKNNAIVSSSPEFSLTYGISELEFTAVFYETEPVDETKVDVVFKDGKTGRIVSAGKATKGEVLSEDLIPALPTLYGYTCLGWTAGGTPIAEYVIETDTTFVANYKLDDQVKYKLTVKDGERQFTIDRAYATIAAVSSIQSDCAYWTINGSFISSGKTVQLSMPNEDCVLEAVTSKKSVSFTPSTALISAFVDESGTLMTTFSRNIPQGYTLAESGILMTRKASASDLTVSSMLNTVTRGISTASASTRVFGFAKADMLSGAKDGTWFFRPYLSYKDASGKVQTTYGTTYTFTVEDGAATAPAPASELVNFQIAPNGFDPMIVDSDIFVCQTDEEAEDYDGLKAFFPSVTQAEDGTLIVVYLYSTGHALYDTSEGRQVGVLKMQKSYDNGETWTEPETIVDLNKDNSVIKSADNRESRDPNLQRLSDGTIVLTFPVRAAIGKAGLNSGTNYDDYWYERSYYMTSIDNGQTWSEMQVLPCNYFSHGQPFLYDDPNKTTGAWVKNGSMAELPNGDLLIPLYGAEDCSTRAIMQSVVIKAHNNGDGTLSFYNDWTLLGEDAEPVTPIGLGDELALVADGNTVYGFLRSKIDASGPSANVGGTVIRSLDGGLTWDMNYAVEETANMCINQPNFTYVTDELVLVNYTVPLGSVNGSMKRSARPVYGKLFNIKTGEWNEYDAVSVFDVANKGQTNTDMGNPASVLLNDGRIFTVFYNNPSNAASIIGGRYSDIRNYMPAGGGGAGEGELVYSENFDALANASYSETGSITKDLSLTITGTGNKHTASASIDGGALKLVTSNMRGTTTNPLAVPTVYTPSIDSDATIQFNYSFSAINAQTGTLKNGLRIGLYDDGSDTAPCIEITPTYITNVKGGANTTKLADLSHTANTTYTAKVMVMYGTVYVKVWQAGTAEPTDWLCEAPVTVSQGNPFSIAYNSCGSSTSAVSRTLTVDNITIKAAGLKVGGLAPERGLNMRVGQEIMAKVRYETELEIEGTQAMQAYSDNPSVATLANDGTVTAVGSGIAHIIATLKGETYVLTVNVA